MTSKSTIWNFLRGICPNHTILSVHFVQYLVDAESIECQPSSSVSICMPVGHPRKDNWYVIERLSDKSLIFNWNSNTRQSNDNCHLMSKVKSNTIQWKNWRMGGGAWCNNSDDISVLVVRRVTLHERDVKETRAFGFLCILVQQAPNRCSMTWPTNIIVCQSRLLTNDREAHLPWTGGWERKRPITTRKNQPRIKKRASKNTEALIQQHIRSCDQTAYGAIKAGGWHLRCCCCCLSGREFDAFENQLNTSWINAGILLLQENFPCINSKTECTL